MADGTERRIDEVRLMDQVLTAEGNFGTVVKTMVRQSEEIVRLLLFGHKHLRATEEHPILTKRGYVPIKDLHIGDWVAMPRFMANGTSSIITADHVKTSRSTIRQERRIKYAGVVGRAAAIVSLRPLPEIIPLNTGVGRILGLFLAEGNTSGGKVEWSFALKEKNTLVAELSGHLESELHVTAHVAPKPANNVCHLGVYGKGWAALFESLMSTGSGKKRLHSVITTGPRDFQEAIFEGWMAGDGYARRGNRQGVTVSHQLAMGMYDIAQSIGKRPSIRRSEPKISHGVKVRQPRWDLEMAINESGVNYRSQIDDKHVWRKVQGVVSEPFEGPVYNLEVEGDNSYVAEGVGVHNCVGHAIAHEGAARPVVVEQVTHETAMEIYRRALQLDPWEGEEDEGTSVLAGIKAATERGWYKEYRWAFGLADMLDTLGYWGPCVLGINWYEQMFFPDSVGVIRPEGEVAGGHAILAMGVSINKKRVRLHNSWGDGWGLSGDCYISFDDLDRLLQEQGECCIPIKRSHGPRT